MRKEGTGKRGKKCIERIERRGVNMGSKEERSTKTKAKCVAKMICFSRGALFLKYSRSFYGSGPLFHLNSSLGIKTQLDGSQSLPSLSHPLSSCSLPSVHFHHG